MQRFGDTSKHFWPDDKKVHEKLTKVITIQSLGTEDVWTQPHGNPSDSHWDISVGTQVVDWPTDIAIPWTVLLLWQRKTMQPNNKRHCLCLVVFLAGHVDLAAHILTLSKQIATFNCFCFFFYWWETSLSVFFMLYTQSWRKRFTRDFPSFSHH